MDFEIQYVRSRAMEEREAARAATSAKARKAHMRLAKIFEAHAAKYQNRD